jgi:hypothetical protein
MVRVFGAAREAVPAQPPGPDRHWSRKGLPPIGWAITIGLPVVGNGESVEAMTIRRQVPGDPTGDEALARSRGEGGLMEVQGRIVRLALVMAAVGGVLGGEAVGGPIEEADAFVVRLVHPDRQAAEVLRLFEGARWSDPAAAMAAWKQGAPPSGQLAKPVEAVIAFFNPEMIPEWRAFDDAEVRMGLDPVTGGLAWFALIPRDDGAVAAGITASRLTYPDDRPIVVDGRERPVARIGRSGVPLACQVGAVVIVASSRDMLLRGVGVATAGRNPRQGGTSNASGAAGRNEARGAPLPAPPVSGIVFHLDPARLTSPRDGHLGQARAIEMIHATGCRQVDGIASLKDGTIALDVTTTFDRPRPRDDGARPRTVDIAWLEALPSSGVMAMVSLAIDPEPAAWDRAFELAARFERADPARAGLAPLRTRLNLLAAAAGLKLEADLRPHLRGLSACLTGDPARPGRPTGALIVLHLDETATAERLVRESSARLRTLLGGGAPERPAGADPQLAERNGNPMAEAPRQVGELAGRPVAVWALGRDIWMAWGEAAPMPAKEDPPAPGRSLAAICGGWAGEGRSAPARIVAFWPARLWCPAGLAEAAPSSLRALADDPPVVWWGWSGSDRDHDLIRWRGLSRRVRKFLETLPAAPGRDP